MVDRVLRGLLRELRAVDHAAYAAVALTPTPTLDVPLRRLSTAADYSQVWLGIAALLALVGGRTGRRAALLGATSIGVTSAAVNLGLKAVGRRRPDREGQGVPLGRHVRMPTSASFPSGHSAAGFAFANAVSAELPGLALPLHLLALFVAYSRVHTGVHYPSDAIAGALVGGVVGQTVASLACYRPRRRQESWPPQHLLRHGGPSSSEPRSSRYRLLSSTVWPSCATPCPRTRPARRMSPLK